MQVCAPRPQVQHLVMGVPAHGYSANTGIGGTGLTTNGSSAGRKLSSNRSPAAIAQGTGGAALAGLPMQALPMQQAAAAAAGPAAHAAAACCVWRGQQPACTSVGLPFTRPSFQYVV